MKDYVNFRDKLICYFKSPGVLWVLNSIFCLPKCWETVTCIFHWCVILFLENIFSIIVTNGVVNYFSLFYALSPKQLIFMGNAFSWKFERTTYIAFKKLLEIIVYVDTMRVEVHVSRHDIRDQLLLLSFQLDMHSRNRKQGSDFYKGLFYLLKPSLYWLFM